MIPELGHFALVLAFFVSLASSGVAGTANLRRGVAMAEFTRSATLALFGLVLFAFVCLMISRSEEHTSELQSPRNISYAVFCL